MIVRVFKNLNKGCLSVTAMEGEHKGRVIAHVHSVYLSDCKMVVHEKSRQTVIRERCKNVHAWVQGRLECAKVIALRYPIAPLPDGQADHEHPHRVRYNPYERGEFFRQDTGESVWSCGCADIRADGVWVE